LGYYPQLQQQQVAVPVNNQASSPSMNMGIQQNSDIQPMPNLEGEQPDVQKMSTASPGYFYYVSVCGGTPQYVSSSNLFNSEVPTSLKAHLAGAVPMDARHDPQVPHQNMGVVQNEVGSRTNPPVYLDMDPYKMSQGYSGSSNGDNQNSMQNQNQQQQPLTIVGFIPGAFVSVGNGGFVKVDSAAVAQSGNGDGASVQIRSNTSPGQGQGGTSFQNQFPFLIFNNQKF